MIRMQNGWMLVRPILNEAEKEFIVGASNRGLELEYARVESEEGNYPRGLYVAMPKGSFLEPNHFQSGGVDFFKKGQPLRIASEKNVVFSLDTLSS